MGWKSGAGVRQIELQIVLNYHPRPKHFTIWSTQTCEPFHPSSWRQIVLLSLSSLSPQKKEKRKEKKRKEKKSSPKKQITETLVTHENQICSHSVWKATWSPWTDCIMTFWFHIVTRINNLLAYIQNSFQSDWASSRKFLAAHDGIINGLTGRALRSSRLCRRWCFKFLDLFCEGVKSSLDISIPSSLGFKILRKSRL